MAIREISSEDASKYDDGATVLVLKDTFGKLRQGGTFLNSLASEVAYQRNCRGVVTRSRAPFAQIRRELPFSHHEDSILLMDENILLGADGILDEAPSYLQEDWFHHFPEMLRPSRLCLILGGTGSRSDLHADPLSWTGWNCLLQGSKAWRFYCHEHERSEPFQSSLRPSGSNPRTRRKLSFAPSVAALYLKWTLSRQERCTGLSAWEQICHGSQRYLMQHDPWNICRKPVRR